MFRYLIIVMLTLLIDQGTKWAVATYMKIGETIPLIPGVFLLTSHRNPGAAFGILQNQRFILIVVTVVVIVGISYYLKTNAPKRPFLSFALSLVLGGAIGNLLDRVVKGEVVDMLDFRLIDYPIFNFADCFIVTGTTMMLMNILLVNRKEEARKKHP